MPRVMRMGRIKLTSSIIILDYLLLIASSVKCGAKTVGEDKSPGPVMNSFIKVCVVASIIQRNSRPFRTNSWESQSENLNNYRYVLWLLACCQHGPDTCLFTFQSTTLHGGEGSQEFTYFKSLNRKPFFPPMLHDK